jgi:hypothetical protein
MEMEMEGSNQTSSYMLTQRKLTDRCQLPAVYDPQNACIFSVCIYALSLGLSIPTPNLIFLEKSIQCRTGACIHAFGLTAQSRSLRVAQS